MKIKNTQIDSKTGGSVLYVVIIPALMAMLLPGLVFVSMIPARTQAKSRDRQVTSYDSQVQAYMLEDNYINALSLPDQDELENIVSQFALTSDECVVSGVVVSDDQVSGQIVCQKNDQSNSSDFLIALLEDGDSSDDDDDDDDSGSDDDDSDSDDDDSDSDDDDSDSDDDDNDDSGFPYNGEDWKKNGKKASKDPCDTSTTFSSSGRYSPDHVEQYFDSDPDFSNGGSSKWCYKLDS